MILNQECYMAEEKKELFIKKYAYENPNVVMVKGEKNVRALALIHIFYSSGWVWHDGNPIKKLDINHKKIFKIGGKNTWTSPLVVHNEETIDKFLNNNIAAKTFIDALEQTLLMAKRPKSEASEIVKRAAAKIYPDYCDRVLMQSKNALNAIEFHRTTVDNLDINVPTDDSLLANMPKKINEEWIELVEEAMLLPKKIAESYPLKVSQNTKNTKKWMEKMMKALKKKGYIFA